MATSFDRWEQDPFFAASEEVQDSADRMESTYRQWIQLRKDAAKPAGEDELIHGELLRELRTALGTAKWQLEELDRATRLIDEDCSAEEDTRGRHGQFVAAIRSRILGVENSLREWSLESGGTALTWVRLDEGERDELANFLSCTASGKEGSLVSSADDVKLSNNLMDTNLKASADDSNNSSRSNELSSLEVKEGRINAHYGTASAAGDIGAWTVTICSEGENTSERSSDDRPNLPPPRILSFSALSGELESSSKMRWYRNGFRKGKALLQHDPREYIPLRNHEVNRGIDICYERSKSCLTSCGDDAYRKQIHGFVGAFQRQLQRYQYHIKYRRLSQVIVWTAFSFVLIVVVVLLMMRR